MLHPRPDYAMATSFINDPEHWRKRAEEARTLANQMNDETAKQTMLSIAADYDRLAERPKHEQKVPGLVERGTRAAPPADIAAATSLGPHSGSQFGHLTWPVFSAIGG
jgi:hypothetical protein